MGQNLNDYLTSEEKKQMDALLQKAKARMEEKGGEGCRGQFIMVACQCECGQANQNDEERDNFP